MGRREAGLRPVDLGRMVGVSSQQIRNYADAGVLPPTSRTPTGYRQFDFRHRRALLTYRALAAGYGRETAGEIMRAVHADDLPRALALVDASHAALHEQRRALRAAGDALEAAAGRAVDTSAIPRSGLRIGEIAALLGVRTSTIRLWESAGLLMPRRERGTGYRRFGPADMRDARMITMLRQDGYPLAQIRKVIDGLRRTGSSEALRVAIAHRQSELTERATAMLEGASYLHHYLRGDEPPGPRENTAEPDDQ
ncbi:MerR family transcriptional regulator [Streptoalloteichus hindustanus]|uniref:DNA-binding transcriptional regulator, MerR family n=1 Tax=Streptoalloteichus hindustanus TaxID=2017 RepID=A0A1M4ZEQ8_STRHI|nr:MerR family transcriptional regulator [Streptoalloteichus hindustanus]SHF16510.1 DNA-binding transcriptional regulator, MerR family [Streptoalloteichus hindustanus]